MSKGRFGVIGILILGLVFLISGCFYGLGSGNSSKLTLTMTVEGQGTVEPASGSQFVKNTLVTLTPKPSTGWVFDHWAGANGSQVKNNKIIMDANKSITAVFVKTKYPLNITVSGQGSVTQEIVAPAKGLSIGYEKGTRVRLTAVPAAGWTFDHWEGMLSGNENPKEVTVAGETSVTALFVKADVLVYDESNNGFAKTALTDLGIEFEVIDNMAGFVARLSEKPWHLAVVDNGGNSNTGLLDGLKGYVEAGGRLAFSSWQTSPNPTHPLWALLGSTSNGALTTPEPVYKWSSHPIFTTPNSVPDFTVLANHYGVDTFPGSTTGSGIALGGTTPASSAGNGTIFLANSNRTIFNAFLIDDAVDEADQPADVDLDGKADAVEYWENQVCFLLSQSGGAVSAPSVAKTLSKGIVSSNRK